MGNRRFAQVSSDSDVEAGKPSPSSSADDNARPRRSLRLDSSTRRSHFHGFEFDGNQFELEDPVLLTPEDGKQKPYVAIIKDITQTTDGSMMVTGQWFYRPEEAEKKGGGSWQARDTRELFYSFHRDEVPAESVMHKCVVHFVPLNKQLPNRKQHPGFIVQKVYDTEQRKLFKLTDKDYEDKKQHEIDLLVQKTTSRLGELPDVETEEAPAELDDQNKNKRLLRKKTISPLEVSRESDGTGRPEQHKPDTPGTANMSKYTTILAQFKALTKEPQRDKWLEKLLQVVEYACVSSENPAREDEGTDVSPSKGDKAIAADTAQEKGKDANLLKWPDSAVSGVVALEKASHEASSSDFSKYNQNLRRMVFNLKNNSLLARRLLNGDLEPSKILNMSPNELKEGLTAEELARNQPEEPETLQITDARCKRCGERNVGLREIIQAGHGDRYQLECLSCGNVWYASRDEAAMLTTDGLTSMKSIGTVPSATSKFENIEKKKLISPHETEKADISKRSAESIMPTLEIQKSSNKLKADGGNIPPKVTE
ncbi:hypothetical protein Droror1_Dr00026965 [Drosera rotundifolia]